MDVDSDLDGQLLQQFSSLGTDDKDVLIAEFKKLLGDQPTPKECEFFLDMNNWNLQAAICSYYDFNQTNVPLPQVTFVKDITIGEGEAVPPNTAFTKTWHVRNSGDEMWPPGCQLRFFQGQNLAQTDRVLTDTLQPGESTDISVEMRSGSEPGVIQAQWRMCTATGMFFGEPIWVIVTVAEGGLLGVTQQLFKFGSDFASTSPPNYTPNPFATPTKTHAVPGGVLCGSPNSSVLAQHGSPFPTDFSPSPTHSHRLPENSTLSPRSLFPTNGGNGASNCDTITDNDEEMS